MEKTRLRVHQPVGLPLGPLVKEILKIAYRARRPALLEGHTGIGKSDVVAQVARELGIGYTVLDLSLLEPPDLVGLPVISDGRTAYAPPRSLPLDGAGILMLEELNRADRFIQQPALQLLTARRLHEYVLPPGWVAFAAINPETDEYQVTPLDLALRVRFLYLAVRADRDAWLLWAGANGVHPAVLQLARRHDRVLDDTPPRTWTYVSELLRCLTAQEFRDERLLRGLLGGCLSPVWVEELLQDLDGAEAGDGLDLRQLLTAYHTDAALRARVQGLRSEGRTDVLEQLAYRVLQLIDGPELSRALANKEFNLESFEALLTDLPGDHREALQDALGGNRAAAALLTVRAEEVLSGAYPGSNSYRSVGGWANSPGRHHRVRLLVEAVTRFIDGHPNLAALRGNRGAMIGLGRFHEQVHPRWTKPLDEVLLRRDVRPASLGK
jgi:hypothetical protein